MEEIWKPVYRTDLAHVFEVSTWGRARRVDGRARTAFFIPFGGKGGYKQFFFRAEGVTWQPLVHRLVAMTFLENPNNLPEVHHRDSDKENNRLDNLQWVTSSQNQLLTIRDYPKRIGEGHYLSKLTEVQVREIRQRYSAREGLTSISRRFGISTTAAWNVGTRRTWKHVE